MGLQYILYYDRIFSFVLAVLEFLVGILERMPPATRVLGDFSAHIVNRRETWWLVTGRKSGPEQDFS